MECSHALFAATTVNAHTVDNEALLCLVTQLARLLFGPGPVRRAGRAGRSGLAGPLGGEFMNSIISCMTLASSTPKGVFVYGSKGI